MSMIQRILLGSQEARASQRKSLPIFALIFGSILFWELLLHIVLFESVSWRFVYVMLFSAFFAMVVTTLSGWLPKKGNLVVLWLSMGILYLWYAIQLIYYQIFGGCLSVYLIQMGGDAVTNFTKETISGIRQNWYLLLAMTLPLLTTGLCFGKKWLKADRCRLGCTFRQVIACVLMYFVKQSLTLKICLILADIHIVTVAQCAVHDC